MSKLSKFQRESAELAGYKQEPGSLVSVSGLDTAVQVSTDSTQVKVKPLATMKQGGEEIRPGTLHS